MAAIHGRFTRSQILIQNGEWLLPPALGYPGLFLWLLSTCLQDLPECLLGAFRSSTVITQIHFCALGAVAGGPVLLGGGRECACP